MNEVKIGCFGLQGHQIQGSVAGLTRARLTAFGGLDQASFEAQKEARPEVFADTAHFEDFETFLREGEMDLVSLCSQPRADQAELAIAALKSGRHVVAEKPMATSIADLDALKQAAADSGRKLWTMTSMVYYPAVKALKAVVDSGDLGTIVQIYAMKSYPYNDGRPQDRRVDGGIIQAAIHAVSIVGEIADLEFEDVVARETSTGNPKDGDLQMGFSMTCRMSNGPLTTILANYCNPRGIGYHGNDQVRIHGTDAMVEIVDGFTRRTLVHNDKDRGPTDFPDDDSPPHYPQDLVDAILDGTPTLLTEEASFRYTEVVLRAQESATRGVLVTL